MSLHPCPTCTELVATGICVCPHCGGKACRSARPTGAAVLLGLSLVACGPDSGGDTAGPTSGTTAAGTLNQPEYGVASTTDGGNEAAASHGLELAGVLLDGRLVAEAPEPD